MNRFRKSTIKDVARQAGVSTTTVSYVVSGRRNVCSTETEERIRAAVDLLHYTPSSLVSGMQTNIRFGIGACITSPFDPHVEFGGGFFHRIWHGLCQEADIANYSLLRYPASTRCSGSCDDFLDGRVDGVLFHAHTYDNIRPAKIASAGMPIVLLTRSLNIPIGCASAFVDETEVVELALNRLKALGHSRIAHIGGPVAPSADGSSRNVDDVAIQRLQNYQAWMTRHGLENPAYVHTAPDWNRADMLPVLKIWSELPEPPTAIFCASDALALSALRAADQLNWNVPQSLSIIGIDNSNEATEGRVALSTIDVPVENVARESVRCLLRLISGEQPEDNLIAVGGATWIERGSVVVAARK